MVAYPKIPARHTQIPLKSRWTPQHLHWTLQDFWFDHPDGVAWVISREPLKGLPGNAQVHLVGEGTEGLPVRWPDATTRVLVYFHPSVPQEQVRNCLCFLTRNPHPTGGIQVEAWC